MREIHFEFRLTEIIYYYLSCKNSCCKQMDTRKSMHVNCHSRESFSRRKFAPFSIEVTKHDALSLVNSQR